VADVKTAGRYQLQDELGRGAMGVVYKAHDPTIGRTVAVKTMRLAEAQTGLSHDELIARFGVETRAAGLLTHPNIVVVYDAGEDHGLFYITMEYVQGRSLQAMMDDKQVFPLPRVIKIVEQAGSALDFAHQNNVVHRDIKPANLMMTGDDVVKVTDFGTAKILQKGATQTGAILGTPSYMSPEQVKGKPVDGRSDIFSLGVILYELVTSEKPFPGQNVTTVIYKIVNEEPIPPRELDTSIHPGLNFVITKALSKDPDQRYQSCKELFTDLRNYRELGGDGPIMDTATVVMPGRSRPKAVEEEIARQQAAKDRPPHAVTAMPKPQPEVAAPRPLPKPMTLPPLTGSIPRPAPPQKKGSGSVWLGLILLLAVGAGGYALWPTLRDTLQGNRPADSASLTPATPPGGATDAAKSAPDKAGDSSAAKLAEPEPEPAASDPDSARVQTGIEQRLNTAGFSRIRARVDGKNLTLTGRLTPAEHRRLRGRIARLAPGLTLNDRIEVAEAGAPVAAALSGEESRPRVAPGRGEIEVITGDLLGATVTLKGPKGETQTDRSPTRFEDLAPGRYGIEITKEGYGTENRIVNLTPGRVQKVEVTLRAMMGGVLVNSSPANATIFINGKRQEENTPATIRLTPGTYRVEVAMEGYQGAAQTVQVQGEDLKRADFTLPRLTSGTPGQRPAAPASAQGQAPAPQRATSGPGFLEIRTIPPGADIIINGTNTGRKTPARLELPAGTYRVTIYLRGYQALQRQVAIEDGKTFPIAEALAKQ
jgi:serine/threonine-protein kinase